MAQRMEVQFTDDIDGGPADTTISFAVDGTGYEIDLSAAHAEEIRQAVQPFVTAARKVGGRRTGKSGRAVGPDPSAVRAWARTEGMKVSDRGRVPADLIVKYREAHAH
ncbi:MAG TPA: Lsr2 family protein [Streptosporangiaceae bacterium]|nr:Lsr2 family protein [Streptosporangiaceae bacterium]